jgi:hypothetical protein
VSYALGVLGLLQGTLDTAERDLRQAVDESRRVRARPYEGHALAALAAVLDAAGGENAAEAAGHRDAARAIARDLGMARLARDVDAARGPGAVR